ncbi:type 1 fimbrial protein [Proteus mirabilis]|uniref:type 1 fimbrial protein n=6 Tax=Proteus mirabilis TaxID=584 RepID=UPI000D80B75E|nr:type 1 fimbrial protein [Proteus mirabilis]EMC9359449.1 type 1 fimbrial protein [Proteus mirabilis]EMD6180347.1 type 1 fimbrial protein [Proteus mirabilis]MBI6344195.1 type 1 fimbrial protein [Proteus mirabilis]MBI6432168.1 type 1 fimbrial protein [Proteus mirabilis]MDC5878257.1 type 1 fimbrial protein [Proteus mirabilis]
MKKLLLSLTMLAIISTPVLAKSPVANLKINGDIKPPTCTINGATQSDVIFDYGVISPTLIPQSTIYSYPASIAQNTVTIECDAKTYLTFVASDTYADTELSVNNTSGWFHLVDKANPEIAVGASYFVWDNVIVDGKPAYISRATDVAITGNDFYNVLYKGPTNGWTSKKQSDTNKNSLDLIAGKVFQSNFRQGIESSSNQTFILSRDELSKKGIDLSNGLDFMGEAVLTFNFGV